MGTVLIMIQQSFFILDDVAACAVEDNLDLGSWCRYIRLLVKSPAIVGLIPLFRLKSFLYQVNLGFGNWARINKT